MSPQCPCQAYVADPDLDDDDIWEVCKCGHTIDEHEDNRMAPCAVEVWS